MLSGGRKPNMSTTVLHGENFLQRCTRCLCRATAGTFQNHMPRGLKGLFRETLSAVNILFNWELPPYNFCALLIWFATYWASLELGSRI